MGRTRQPDTRQAPCGSLFRLASIGLMARHLKDASGAATATGLRPVLDLPGHKPQTGSYPETGDAQSRTPAHPPNPAIHVLDAAPLLQG